MRTDLRVKHDVETRRRASELFERGYGRISTAKALRVPRQTVEKWQQIYRAIGREALLSMGGKQASYTYEQKVAAASAVVDGGATKAEAMAEFGIMSLAPLERWCRLYREGGAEALPRAGARGALPQARDGDRLPKKIARPGGAGRSLTRARAEAVSALRAEGHDLGRLLGAREVHLLLRAVAPGQADAPGAARGGRGDLHAHRERLRPQAGGHVPARRAWRARCRQDRAQDHARDGDSLRDTPRDRLPPLQLLQGRRRRDVREHRGARLLRRRPVAEDGNRRDGVQAALGQGLLRARVRLREQGDRGVVDVHQLLERMPEGARPVLHSDMGWQYQHAGWCGRLKAAGIVQSMSRKGNCIDNGATEQVFGLIKDEFFRGRTWPDFESFKADLDDYVVHWNTRRRQVKLKGLTPEEFRSQSLVA